MNTNKCRRYGLRLAKVGIDNGGTPVPEEICGRWARPDEAPNVVALVQRPPDHLPPQRPRGAYHQYARRPDGRPLRKAGRRHRLRVAGHRQPALRSTFGCTMEEEMRAARGGECGAAAQADRGGELRRQRGEAGRRHGVGGGR